MLQKSMRSCAIGVAFILIAAGKMSQPCAAQSAFVLQPPNYSNATEVGRHVAYSLILVNLINASRDAAAMQRCYFDFANVDFPNFSLYGQSSTSRMTCHDYVDQLLDKKNFNQADVDSAIAHALQHYRRAEIISSWANKYPYGILVQRLGAMGELALKKLYPSDPFLMPLLEFDEWLRRQSNLDDFKNWLADQFNFRRLNADLSLSSKPVFPLPAKPEIDYAEGLKINTTNPELSGHKLIVIQCNTSRDWNCAYKDRKHFCNKTKEEIIAGETIAKEPRSPSALRCANIGYIINMPGFLAIDAEDNNAVLWLYNELTSRLRSTQRASLIEHIVLVTME